MVNVNSIKLLIALSTALAISGLSGCKLINPYIDEAKLVDSDGNDLNLCQPIGSAPDSAIKCTRKLKSEYISGMGEQAELTSLTGLGLIPLTALTIGFAASGDSASKISDFALGSASVYSLSAWLSSPERTRIYALGHQAMQCAEQVSMPFLVNAGLNKELETNKLGLNDYVGDLNSILSAAEVSFVQAKQSSIKSEFEAAKIEASEVLQNAAALDIKFKQAPGALIVNAQRINSAVNLSLTNSIQSLSALPSILNGMGELYSNNKASFTGFMPVTEESGSDLDAQGLGQIDARATIDFEEQLNNVKNAIKHLKYFVSSMTPLPATATLESCGVDTSKLVGGLTVNPTHLEFSSSKITHSISTNGGSETYVYEASEKLFEVNQNTPFGGVFSIKLKSEPQDNGNYFIKIKDSTGRAIDVPIAIKKATAKTVNNEATISGSQENCALSDSLQADEAELCFNEDKTKAIQQALNSIDSISIKDDGDYGEDTRKALLAFTNLHVHLDSGVSSLNIQAVLDFYHESQLRAEDLRSYLKDLGVLDSESNKIEKVQEAQQQSSIPETGFVGPDLLPIAAS